MTIRHDLGLTSAQTSGGGCCGGGGCMCGHGSAEAAPTTTTADISIRVDGLTCTNCVTHVTEAVAAVCCVGAVTVDLNAGGTSTVHITADGTVNLDDVRAAIIDAGYQPA